MAKREIIFSLNAENQLHIILETLYLKTKTSTRSEHLFKMFKIHLSEVLEEPQAGIKTLVEGVRGVYAEDYILFYEVAPAKIFILKIWDCSKHLENPGL